MMEELHDQLRHALNWKLGEKQERVVSHHCTWWFQNWEWLGSMKYDYMTSQNGGEDFKEIKW